jgi:uncharacterized protein (UPF0335 family)
MSNNQLKSLVDRIENLDSQIKGLQSDKRDIFQEAQSAGFDGPALREILRLRRMEAKKRETLEETVEVYKTQLSML